MKEKIFFVYRIKLVINENVIVNDVFLPDRNPKILYYEICLKLMNIKYVVMEYVLERNVQVFICFLFLFLFFRL